MSVSDNSIKYIQDHLLDWFKSNGRSFPWRNKSASNYVRIISEVLLQRTKAETVANYFKTFTQKYPSWKQLGNASQDDLEEIMRPLGLQKQRASRLFKLAQEMKKRRGLFPKNVTQVSEMPMMGQYISNAYKLFILKRPAPLLDINMARVLERFFEPRKLADLRYDPYLQALANKIVANKYSKEINWSILDLGAMVCKAKTPLCNQCPIKEKCSFYRKIIN